MCIDELGTAMAALGVPRMSAEQLKQVMDKMDTDRSGSIDFDEFTALMGPMMFDVRGMHIAVY